MSKQEQHDLFCELLTLHQGQLHGYILALVGNRADADDLFQSTSMVLWRKFDTFQPGSSFLAWGPTNGGTRSPQLHEAATFVGHSV